MLVRAWDVKGTATGKEVSGRFQFEEAKKDCCLASNFETTLGGEPVEGRHITGWESSTDTIRALGFFSTGFTLATPSRKSSDEPTRTHVW